MPATTVEPQPEPDEQVPGLAGVLMRTLKVTPAQALQIASVLVEAGVRVDVAQQVTENWWSQLVSYYEVNPPDRLTLPAIENAAQEERLSRLNHLSSKSQNELIPNVWAHRHIDNLLREMGY